MTRERIDVSDNIDKFLEETTRERIEKSKEKTQGLLGIAHTNAIYNALEGTPYGIENVFIENEQAVQDTTSGLKNAQETAAVHINLYQLTHVIGCIRTIRGGGKIEIMCDGTMRGYVNNGSENIKSQFEVNGIKYIKE